METWNAGRGDYSGNLQAIITISPVLEPASTNARHQYTLIINSAREWRVFWEGEWEVGRGGGFPMEAEVDLPGLLAMRIIRMQQSHGWKGFIVDMLHWLYNPVLIEWRPRNINVFMKNLGVLHCLGCELMNICMISCTKRVRYNHFGREHEILICYRFGSSFDCIGVELNFSDSSYSYHKWDTLIFMGWVSFSFILSNGKLISYLKRL